MPITSLLAERFANTVAPMIACRELGGTGIHRSSQISTPSVKPFMRAAVEQQVGAERDALPSDAGGGEVRVVGRSEIAGVVELLVVRQVGFRNDAEDFSGVNDRRAQLNNCPSMASGTPTTATPRNFFSLSVATRSSCLLGGPLKRLQVEEIVAGVAGQPALGEDEQVDAFLFGAPGERERAVGVEGQSATRNSGLAAATRRKPLVFILEVYPTRAGA